MRKILFIIFLTLTVSLKAFAEPQEQPIMVFAAASLNEALQQIAADFKKEKGIEVNFNFGGSKNLALQIEKGMPSDIFIAADKESTEKLLSAGRVDNDRIIEMLENRLVVVASREFSEPVQRLFDLNLKKDESFSIADPATAPAGVYATQALQRAGVYDKIKPFLVPSLDVRAAMALVEAGNSKYAMVYATDAKVAKRVKVVYQVPSKLYDRIIYTAALIKHAPGREAALKFMAYLESDHSKAIFQDHGFYPIFQ